MFKGRCLTPGRRLGQAKRFTFLSLHLILVLNPNLVPLLHWGRNVPSPSPVRAKQRTGKWKAAAFGRNVWRGLLDAGYCAFHPGIRESYPFLKALAAEKWNIRPLRQPSGNQTCRVLMTGIRRTARPPPACLLRPLVFSVSAVEQLKWGRCA